MSEAHGLSTPAWVEGLIEGAPEREATIARLHALLVRIARSEAARRAGTNDIRGRELDDLADQAADDALVSILRRLPDFRGDSAFTTWAYKFVIREVAGKLTRHTWRREGVSLDDEAWERLPGRLGADPHDVAQSRALVEAVRRACLEHLTAHQRRVFVAIVVDAVPLDVLVTELHSNRNAIYKTMFDARRKLHKHLTAEGYLDDPDGRTR